MTTIDFSNYNTGIPGDKRPERAVSPRPQNMSFRDTLPRPKNICFPDAPPPWKKGFEIPILRSLRELIRGQSDRQARPICGHRPAGPGPAGARRVTQSRKWAQVIRGQNRSQTLAKFFREQRGRRRERGQRGGSYLFFSSPEEALLALIFWAINWARLSFLSDRCQLCP